MMNEDLLSHFDCVVFDMDGTLAQSKGPITTGMAHCLNALLLVKKVAVISGGRWNQFEIQLVEYLSPARFENLVILPTTGTAMRVFENGEWKEVYDETISAPERKRIITELQWALEKVHYHESDIVGDIIEDRLSQITFSALGSKAPVERKILWDPDQKKRQLIVAVVREKIPEYTITIGGTTSIDITLKGVDKAYGVQKLSDTLNIPLNRIVFVGDKLDEGGNDYPVKRLGIETIAVKDEHETEALLRSWLV